MASPPPPPPPPSSSSYLETRLPFEVLREILGFLHFAEQRRLLSLSQTLWDLRPRLDSKTRVLVLGHEEGRRLILDQPFQSETRLSHMFGTEFSTALVSLTLDGCANDGFLHVALVELELFPNLQSLRLRSCEMVSDFGLDCISRSVAAVNSLQVIDIAFCNHTSYGGTFCLRDRVNNLKILRRQPEWLDGRFETPFRGQPSSSLSSNSDATRGREIHTYYCDGAFHFDRDSQSNGFVTQLFPWDDDFLGDKLQYNNFRVPLGKVVNRMKEYKKLMAKLLRLRPGYSERRCILLPFHALLGWPEWTSFCYRPGVCLLRLLPTEKERRPTVLVGQYMRGLRAPQNRSLMEKAKGLVPLGQSRFFDKNTEEILPYEDAATMTNDEERNVNLNHVIMISRMLVQPLEIDQLMPPESLVQSCRNTCQGLQSYGRDFLITQERNLNHLLAGDEAM